MMKPDGFRRKICFGIGDGVGTKAAESQMAPIIEMTRLYYRFNTQ